MTLGHFIELIRNRRDDPRPGGDSALQIGPEGVTFVYIFKTSTGLQGPNHIGSYTFQLRLLHQQTRLS
jgi:hypothetical protein